MTKRPFFPAISMAIALLACASGKTGPAGGLAHQPVSPHSSAIDSEDSNPARPTGAAAPTSSQSATAQANPFPSAPGISPSAGPDRPGAFEGARIATARVQAHEIHNAALMWMMRDGKKCPTADDLLREKLLQSRTLRDPWDAQYVISCPADSIEVRSAGPDHVLRTADDVLFSEGK